MKKIIFISFLLLSGWAHAGVYEDMEEAIIRGNGPGAVALIQRGMDVNTVDRFGNTLLVQGVVRDMPELVDFLLKHKARLNVRNRNGETALSLAAFNGREGYVKQLVEAGAEINFYGWPPLVYAAYNGHLSIVDYLLGKGAEINAKAENGVPALFFAARFGHRAVVETLLKHGADASFVSEREESAVDWAMKAGNTDIADLLRAAGGRSGKSMVLDLSN